VRRMDWLLFLLALILSAVAYLLPLYVDKSWGTGLDYLAAFTAGAAGQVVVNAALLPFNKSYKSAQPAKAAAAS
jgi:hypothetical protein